MKNKIKKIISAFLIFTIILVALRIDNRRTYADEEIVLRICSWEEYIDEGGWDEEEAIELENITVFGEQELVRDFEEWYYETTGKKVRVEYSCFGTNEELYSQLKLGDTFDLICPSDYMIMKLMTEKKLEPLSDDFFDVNNEYNYYIRGVSPYIRDVFEKNKISGEAWAEYAAGYMWGTTGFVYNPEYVTKKDVSTWSLLINEKYKRQVTIKDNVRDALFPALGILKKELLTSKEFINDENYSKRLQDEMNDTDKGVIDEIEALLKKIRENVYSFETDSGKSDMVTGKIVANLQWSGDGVYAMDQAEEDDVYLNWATPEECTNLWFDGWVMLKSGINGNEEKKQAAESFINFISRPDNVVRNMYYIGYTSVIAGGEDKTVFDYVNYCYGAQEDCKDTVEYPLGYFFTGDNDDEDYVVIAQEESLNRQLSAQYPQEDIIKRSAIMQCFNDEAAAYINRMWINIRCFNLENITPVQWIKAGMVVAVIILLVFLLIIGKRKIRKKSID